MVDDEDLKLKKSGSSIVGSDRTALNLEALPELVAAARKVGVPLDGHTIGMIGEEQAAQMLGLSLMRASNTGYDAVTADGKTVEIKATTGRSVGVRGSDRIPDLMAILQLDAETLKATVCYWGPAAPVWAIAGKPQRNGQSQVSLSRVRSLPGGR